MNISFDSVKCEIKFLLVDGSIKSCWYDKNAKLVRSTTKNTKGKTSKIFTWGRNFREHLLSNCIYFEDEEEQKFFEKFIINLDCLLGIF